MKTKIIQLLTLLMFLIPRFLLAGVSVSHEPQYFFVGTYTNSGSEGIYLFSLDPKSGKLTNHGLAAKSDNPTFMTLSSTGKILLAANEIQDKNNRNMGYIESFAVNNENHHLNFINKVLSGGADPCYVSVNRSGHVLAANYSGGSAALFNMDQSGTLSEFTDLKQHVGSGPVKARQAEPHVHSAYFEPSSNRIFVADLGTDKVAVYLLDERGSKLKNSPFPAIIMPPGSGPRHMAFHPTLKFLYVINEISNTVSVVSLNKDGSYSILETISTLPAGYDKPGNCADIHISNDGRFLYASNRGLNSIAIFSVNPLSGRIVQIGQESTRGEIPRNFTLSPNEDFILVANQNSQNIVSFRRDAVTGKLEYVDQIKSLKPVCLLFCK